MATPAPKPTNPWDNAPFAEAAAPSVNEPIATITGKNPWDNAPFSAGSETSNSPVGDELAQIGTNIVKQTPRHLMQAVGGLADAFTGGGTAATGQPEAPNGLQPELEQHPIVRATAKEMADRMESRWPSVFKPVHPGPFEDIAGAGQEGFVSGLLAGPEGMLPGMASGAASEVAKQLGAGPWTQAAVGALPLTPAAGARGLLQHASPEEIQQRLGNFERAGVSPTGIQVGLGNNTGRATQRTLANQPAELEASLKGSFPPTGKLEGGKAFSEGVARSRLQQAQDESTAFGVSRAMIGGDTPMPATNASKVAQGITHKFDDEKLNDFLASTKSQQIEDVLKSTSKPATQGTILVPGPRGGYAPAEIPQQGMTFDKLRALRSRIGEMIDWGIVPGGNAEANGQLKQLYNAFGQDLEAGISKTSPEAQFAYRKAINLYKNNAAQRELLDTKIKDVGGPEASFDAATNSRALIAGPSQMKTIWNVMNPEEQTSFRNALTTTMQYPKGAAGRGFDENVFRTNWENMHDDVKTMIYGPRGSDMRDKMEGIGNILGIREQLKQNIPTAMEKGQTRATKEGIGAHIGTALKWVAAGVGVEAAQNIPAAMEHVAAHPVLTGVGAVSAATALGAKTAMGRILNNKTALNFLAQANRVPKSALPVFLTQLDRMGQTGQDIKDTIQENQ